MFNVFKNRLKLATPASGREIVADMTRGVNHTALRFRITGTVTIAGGTTSGTVVADGPARLLKGITVEHDSFQYARALEGRDLYLLGKRLAVSPRSLVTLADADEQSDTPISVDVIVPFSWNYLANPAELFLAAQRVEQHLRVSAEWAWNDTTGAVDSGVLVTGGDRTVTVNDLQCELVEDFFAAPVQPMFLPVLSATNTEQYTAANSELPFDLRTNRRVLAHLFQARYGSLGLPQDAINSILLEAGQVQQVKGLSFDMLKGYELEQFPGVEDAEIGALLLPYADNGKLGTVLDPRNMGSNPRYVFNVDAPTSSPGYIRAVQWELMTRAGVTKVQQ